jgi:hypothetical protein
MIAKDEATDRKAPSSVICSSGEFLLLGLLLVELVALSDDDDDDVFTSYHSFCLPDLGRSSTIHISNRYYSSIAD